MHLTEYLALRRGGAVRRWHALSTGNQTVAEHHAQCALLAIRLWPDASKALIAWCLTHDLAEAWIGDMPRTARDVNPALGAAYNAAEQQVNTALELPELKAPLDLFRAHVVDALDCVFFAAEQVRLGARTEYAPVMMRAWEYVSNSVQLEAAFVQEVDAYVRGTLYPVYRCDRCGEPAHLRPHPGTEELWCLSCQSHDYGTVMRTRLTREESVVLGPHYGPIKEVDLTFRVGSDDPIDGPLVTPQKKVAAVGEFRAPLAEDPQRIVNFALGAEGAVMGYPSKGMIAVQTLTGLVTTPKEYWREI